MIHETAVGALRDRGQLRDARGQLAASDVPMATRLDRLARLTHDLLNTLATVTNQTAGLWSLGDRSADTTTVRGRLIPAVLPGVDEFGR